MLHQELAHPLGVVVRMLPQGPTDGFLDEEIGMLAILQNVPLPANFEGWAFRSFTAP